MRLISTETKAARFATVIVTVAVMGPACSSRPQGSPSGSPPEDGDGSAALANDDAGIAPLSNSGGGAVTTPTVPTIGGCPVFPADNPWNTRVDGKMAKMVAAIIRSAIAALVTEHAGRVEIRIVVQRHTVPVLILYRKPVMSLSPNAPPAS